MTTNSDEVNILSSVSGCILPSLMFNAILAAILAHLLPWTLASDYYSSWFVMLFAALSTANLMPAAIGTVFLARTQSKRVASWLTWYTMSPVFVFGLIAIPVLQFFIVVGVHWIAAGIIAVVSVVYFAKATDRKEALLNQLVIFVGAVLYVSLLISTYAFLLSQDARAVSDAYLQQADAFPDDIPDVKKRRVAELRSLATFFDPENPNLDVGAGNE